MVLTQGFQTETATEEVQCVDSNQQLSTYPATCSSLLIVDWGKDQKRKVSRLVG